MKLKRHRDPGLQEAIKVAGSLTALGAAIGVTPQAVSRWKRVPWAKVHKVHRATGIPKRVLCPDWYEDTPDSCHAAESAADEAKAGEDVQQDDGGDDSQGELKLQAAE